MKNAPIALLFALFFGCGDDDGPADSAPPMDSGSADAIFDASGLGDVSDAGGMDGATTEPEPLAFRSSWESGCTGNSAECVSDGGEWGGGTCGVNDVLQVELGGTGGVPPAIDGEYVLEFNPDGESCRGVLEEMFDLSASNHYIRYYEFINCDFPMNGLHGHFFQNFRDRSSTFHFRHTDAEGFPGEGADVQVGYESEADTALVGDCRGSGNQGGRKVNQGEAAETWRKPCGAWYRHELRIECPNGDACLDVGFRESVAVRLHYRFYRVETPGTGMGTLEADNGDMIDSFYNGEDHRSEGLSLEQVYAPVAEGGLDACHAYSGGDTSWVMGPNGARDTPTGAPPWGWVDAMAYRASESGDAWVGASCQAEPDAPECGR